MDLAKSLRVAWVLLASQMRVGRAGSNPRSFFGRPIALLLGNCIALLLGLFGAAAVGKAIAQATPGVPSALLGELLPFVPLAAVGSALLGGMMFELATTTRFATSDAVNWLPIRSREYVLGSTLALVGLYFLPISFLSGIAFGLGAVVGDEWLAALAVVLAVVGLFEGGLLIEIVRAVSQRASTVGPKRGSTAIIARAAVFLLVIFAFETAFNPILLSDAVTAVSGLGPVADVVPLLWSWDAVKWAEAGQYVAVVAAVVANAAFLVLVAQVAVWVRARYWVPVGGEIQFDRHEFGGRSRSLAALGFTRGEVALLGKDLRGLVRRRELLPQLLVPFAVGVILLLSRGSGPGADVVTFGVLPWVTGLSAFLMASQSFGQERRAVVHLYALPVRPGSVLKAKAAASILISLLITLPLLALALVLRQPPLADLPASILAFPIAVVVGTVIGLVVATRWSDFQDRPRPQFVRPLPMLGALALYLILGGAAVGLTIVIGYGALPPGIPVAAVAGAVGVFVVLLAALALLARTGTERLLRQVPA